jgi:hypothetical protein
MRQLLDLARENAVLKSELSRVGKEVLRVQWFLAGISDTGREHSMPRIIQLARTGAALHRGGSGWGSLAGRDDAPEGRQTRVYPVESVALAIPEGQLSHDWRSSLDAIRIALALFALVVVAVMAYRAGYLRGQDELLDWNRSTEAARNALRMTAVLPRWRRVAGWAAYGFAGAAALRVPGPRISVCQGLGVGCIDGGVGALVRSLHGSGLARRAVLAAQPRGPRTAAA